MHYSTDSAQHWQTSSTFPTGIKYDIAVDPDDAELVVFTTADGVRSSVDGGDVFSTSDRRTGLWHKARSTQLLFDPGGQHRLLAATDRGVMAVLLDSPQSTPWSWELLAEGPEAWSLREIGVHPDGAIFMASPAGLFRSPDGGLTWTLEGDFAASYSYMRAVALDLDDPGRLFVGGKSRLFLSPDGGQSLDALYTITGGWGITDVWVRGDRIHLGTDQYYATSSDGGTTWYEAQIFGAARDVNELLVIESPVEEVLVATDDGVYLTADAGQSFEDVSGGLPTEALNALALEELGDGTLLVGTADGVHRRSPQLSNWQRSGLDSHAVYDLLARADQVVAATDEGVYLSDDGGLTWSEAPGLTGLAASCLARDPNGHLLVGTRGFGLFRSEEPL